MGYKYFEDGVVIFHREDYKGVLKLYNIGKSIYDLVQIIIMQEGFFMFKNEKWPENCIWPKPVKDGVGDFWDADDAYMEAIDGETEELLAIKEYYDSLVEEGRLNEDYSLNGDYDESDYEKDADSDDDSEEWDDAEWGPEIGEEYWEDGFLIDLWEDDLSYHMGLLKLTDSNPVGEIQRITEYEFVNENLLRQAFTRRAFGVQYGVGDSERLEFVGDTVLGMIVTREITGQLASVDKKCTEGPFRSDFSEGDFSKIRSRLVGKEHLASRVAELGLDKYILYGSGEEPGESSREDMMEALIGAIAIDSNWNWAVLEDVVDRLVCVQLMKTDEYLKATHYDLFNAWHQKHFGKMPEYEIYRGHGMFYCTIRFFIPENDRGIDTCQRIDVQDESRSRAREIAARKAYDFVVYNGLWINLADAHVVPSLENAINQLQELYQKKYVEMPVYEFEERPGDEWYCSCVCSGADGTGIGKSKTEAKKKAAFMVLERLLGAAGGRK